MRELEVLGSCEVLSSTQGARQAAAGHEALTLRLVPSACGEYGGAAGSPRAATEIERAQGDYLLAAARAVGPERAARISAGSCELGGGAREQRYRARRRARASQ